MTELERALIDLGRELDVPSPPDAVAAVRSHLVRPGRRSRRRPVALALAVVLLAAIAAALAVPQARSALLRVLHIGGERIELVDELPSISPVESGLGLDVLLGERVSLAEARRRAVFPLGELDEAPDRVYVGPRDTVWFLYGSPDHVRLLVAQTRLLSIDGAFLHKKLVGTGTRVEEVSVDGAKGVLHRRHASCADPARRARRTRRGGRPAGPKRPRLGGARRRVPARGRLHA